MLGENEKKPAILWTRTWVTVPARLRLLTNPPNYVELPSGARGEWLVRDDGGIRVVSVFLRNTNSPVGGPDDPEDRLYQPRIIVRDTAGRTSILNRADRFNQTIYDPDLESYRLLYRDKPEFAVGHGCATAWDNKECPADRARVVMTDLLPSYTVTATEAKGGVGLSGLDMAGLAQAPDGAGVSAALKPLLDQYEQWINNRRREIPSLPTRLRPKASEHIDDCEESLSRMRTGLRLLSEEPLVLEAFRFANEATMLQRRKSVEAANYQKGKGRVFDAPAPAWRPFQIAFILLNLEGIVKPQSADRELVDLLWFPTGGGKTEAYLGLAAFTMALRRLRHTQKPRRDASGDGGVTVLMRYTLRLLTIQQFQRAATLICACECLRRRTPECLGKEQFSIGLAPVLLSIFRTTP